MSDELDKMVKVLEDMPDDGKPKGLIQEVNTTYKCVCGKTVSLPQLRTINSGVLPQVIDDVCIHCDNKDAGSRLDRETAKLVCCTCHRVIRRLAPWTDPRSGFTFRPGKCYHVRECPECAGKDGEYKVLEMVIHNRKLLKKPDRE